MPKDEGPGQQVEGCITAEVFQAPSSALQGSRTVFPKPKVDAST